MASLTQLETLTGQSFLPLLVCCKLGMGMSTMGSMAWPSWEHNQVAVLDYCPSWDIWGVK